MSTRQVILHIDIIKEILSETKFNKIDDYIKHMRVHHGLCPYKKDIKPSQFYGVGEEIKMNHFSIRKGEEISENYRFYVVNKRKYMLAKINYGI
jgi:hypothetical protein